MTSGSAEVGGDVRFQAECHLQNEPIACQYLLCERLVNVIFFASMIRRDANREAGARARSGSRAGARSTLTAASTWLQSVSAKRTQKLPGWTDYLE